MTIEKARRAPRCSEVPYALDSTPLPPSPTIEPFPGGGAVRRSGRLDNTIGAAALAEDLER
jgi:hypothetical protein